MTKTFLKFSEINRKKKLTRISQFFNLTYGKALLLKTSILCLFIEASNPIVKQGAKS